MNLKYSVTLFVVVALSISGCNGIICDFFLNFGCLNLGIGNVGFLNAGIANGGMLQAGVLNGGTLNAGTGNVGVLQAGNRQMGLLNAGLIPRFGMLTYAAVPLPLRRRRRR